ncbi:MAG: hypothetical protein KF773_26785 [Deltaproteobacteria bacterium]|nr:hypothetical protein [Deltaproteobacteria bacterium]
MSEDLQKAAVELSLDPTLDERQLALEVLAALGIDVTRAAAPMAGNLVAIEDQDSEYLVARAVRTARFTARERRLQGLVENTLSTEAASRWCRKLGADVGPDDLRDAARVGQIRARRVSGAFRFDPDDLSAFARYHAQYEAVSA